MCKIAEQVFEDNSVDVSKINLVNQSSRNYKGRDLNVENSINLIVSEIFDTELIGEGCLDTFIHAFKDLARTSNRRPIMVPWGATVYAVPIKSKFIESFIDIKSGVFGFASEYDELTRCRGLASPLEIHFSCVENFETDFVQVSDPVGLNHFNFEQLGKENLHEVVEAKFMSTYTGCIKAVLMFWCLHLDREVPTLDLSTAPKLIKTSHFDERHVQQWREHWVQGIYPVKELDISAGKCYNLKGCHDEYTFWFEITEDVVDSTGKSAAKDSYEPPSCSCGMHVGLNRNRIYILNDQYYAHKVKKALSSIPDFPHKAILITGNFNLTLMKLVSEMNPSEIICEETSSVCFRTLRKLIKSCNLTDKIRLVTSFNEDINADVVIGEPFYMSSLLPWHHAFMFLEVSRKLRQNQTDLITIPARGCIKCALIRTAHLHRLRAPVPSVRGVNLNAFNKLVIPMADKCFTNLESHYLFQYETYFISRPLKLMDFVFCGIDNSDAVNHLERDIIFEKDFTFDATGNWRDSNAIVFWMEYHLGADESRGCEDVYDEGPIMEDACRTEQSSGPNVVKWSPGHKQAVAFIQPRLHQGFSILIDGTTTEVNLL